MNRVTLAFRFGVLLLIVLLGWRAIGSGLADYYVAQDQPLVRMKALYWRENQPRALQVQAKRQIFLPAAKESLQRAAWANPADALIYLELARTAAGYLQVVVAGALTYLDLAKTAADDLQAAARLVEIADALGPMRSSALARSEAFWRKQNRLDLMLRRQSTLLQTRPTTSTLFFPEWLRFAEEPASRPLLATLLANSPDWWNKFFSYAANKTQKTETVTFLYQNRWGYGSSPAAADLKIYLDRLLRDQNWPEAYRVWRAGLDKTAREALDKDGIYNSGFELPLSGLGFDWRVMPVRGVTVEAIETYGVRNGKALHIAFDEQRIRFQHISQLLYLEPNKYRLRGRVKPDNLRAEWGLRWILRCNGGQAQRLAESERFFGSDDWRTFVVNFTVPETNCQTQMLRLELEGQAELDFEIGGEIWFDNLTVTWME